MEYWISTIGKINLHFTTNETNNWPLLKCQLTIKILWTWTKFNRSLKYLLWPLDLLSKRMPEGWEATGGRACFMQDHERFNGKMGKITLQVNKCLRPCHWKIKLFNDVTKFYEGTSRHHKIVSKLCIETFRFHHRNWCQSDLIKYIRNSVIK